jgi:hypothetical protein
MLTPQVHYEVTGTYHGDSLYPTGLEKHPHVLLRSCRTSTGWCKGRLEPSEVLRLYDISDSVTLGLNPDLKSKVIISTSDAKILLSTAIAVSTEVPEGVDLIQELRVKVRQEEEPEDTLVQDQERRLGHLGERKSAVRAGTRGHQR